MIQKTELEVRKAQMLKAARSTVRLSYSIAADARLNEVLPELEKAIDKALQQGKPFDLNVNKYLEN